MIKISGTAFFIDCRAIDGVAARRIAAVGPIEDTVRQIEFEIDRLRQLIEQHFDVGAVRRARALGNVDVRAEDTTPAGVVEAFLRPVDFLKLRIDGDADTPSGLIAPIIGAATSFDQCLDLRAVEVRAHHAHPLAVAPIELAIVLIEVKLLRRVGTALRDDHPPITAVEIGALDRAVVEIGHAHVGPIDVDSLRIDGDAVREMATGNNGLAVGSVRIH